MQYRPFGNLGWKVSALGFGCMRLPTIDNDENSANINEKETTKMLHYAIEHGLNYVDTAYPYHAGASETSLGKILQGEYRQKVKLATKFPTWQLESTADFDKYLNEQLQKLQTDHIDFYLFHTLKAATWRKVCDLNVLACAEKARQDGRIGHLGFSTHEDFPTFQSFVDGYDGWEFCQFQYNYMDIDNQVGMKGLKYAAARGLAVVVMEPLLGGKLVNLPPPVTDLWKASKVHRSPADLALQWLWNQPEVSVVLSGMSSLRQVQENIASAEQSGVNRLRPDEQAFIDQIRGRFAALNPIPCTGCGYCLPCPNGVEIARVFHFYNEGIIYNDPKRARFWYKILLTADKRASACIQCQECEEKCPQHIPISEWMPRVQQVLEHEQPYPDSDN